MQSIKKIRKKIISYVEGVVVDFLGFIGFLHDPVITNKTGKYIVPLNSTRDWVVQHIKDGKVFDEKVVDTVKKLYKEGDILDIGANFGQMSVQFSRFIDQINSARGSSYHLYSFEANPLVFKYLSKNIELNCRETCTVIFGAVWNEPGKTAFFPGYSRAKEVTYGSYKINFDGSGFPVTTITIDTLNFKNKVGVIKTDIQGADLRALQGAKELIKRDRPIIISEYESRYSVLFGDTFDDYLKFFESINYDVIFEQPPQTVELEWAVDLVCIPK